MTVLRSGDNDYLTLTRLRMHALEQAVVAMSSRAGAPEEFIGNVVKAADAFYKFAKGEQR